jgi:predicted enzyme related to lactoylglutathione lyase
MQRTQHGHVHWSELMSHEPDKARRFYQDALGWTFSEMPMPNGRNYLLAMCGGETPIGGIYDLRGDPQLKDVPSNWMTYIAVDDIDTRIARAQAAGGTVIQPPFDMEGVGRIAMVMQSDGAMVGWITPADGTA